MKGILHSEVFTLIQQLFTYKRGGNVKKNCLNRSFKITSFSQSEVSSRRIREASSGASSNKQMNRLSMGECSSSGSIKSTKSSNAAPLPNTSQQPTQPATNTTTTTTTNNSQGELDCRFFLFRLINN